MHPISELNTTTLNSSNITSSHAATALAGNSVGGNSSIAEIRITEKHPAFILGEQLRRLYDWMAGKVSSLSASEITETPATSVKKTDNSQKIAKSETKFGRRLEREFGKRISFVGFSQEQQEELMKHIATALEQECSTSEIIKNNIEIFLKAFDQKDDIQIFNCYNKGICDELPQNMNGRFDINTKKVQLTVRPSSDPDMARTLPHEIGHSVNWFINWFNVKYHPEKSVTVGEHIVTTPYDANKKTEYVRAFEHVYNRIGELNEQVKQGNFPAELKGLNGEYNQGKFNARLEYYPGLDKELKEGGVTPKMISHKDANARIVSCEGRALSFQKPAICLVPDNDLSAWLFFVDYYDASHINYLTKAQGADFSETQRYVAEEMSKVLFLLPDKVLKAISPPYYTITKKRLENFQEELDKKPGFTLSSATASTKESKQEL